MNTKLTLTIEASIIEKAKIYACNKERSLSDLIENFLMALTNDETKEEIELSPAINKMRGAFKIPSQFDYKKEITDRLSEKYLK